MPKSAFILQTYSVSHKEVVLTSDSEIFQNVGKHPWQTFFKSTVDWDNFKFNKYIQLVEIRMCHISTTNQKVFFNSKLELVSGFGA